MSEVPVVSDALDHDYRGVAVVFIILCAGVCFGCLVGGELSSARFKREAVASGHAEYTTDDRGNAVWRWKVIEVEDLK